MSKLLRLYLPHEINLNNELELSQEDKHYLINVMRKKEGDEFIIFNEKSGEFIAQITKANKKCEFRVISKLKEPEISKEINLAFSIIKPHRLHYLIEKATELGVTELTPVITERSFTSKFNVQKFFTVAKEASEQCERISVPKINEPIKLEKYLSSLNEKLFVAIEEKIEEHFKFNNDISGRINILIGPEGGFSKEEQKLILSNNNVKAVNLGKRILRSETAAAYMLSIINYGFNING